MAIDITAKSWRSRHVGQCLHAEAKMAVYSRAFKQNAAAKICTRAIFSSVFLYGENEGETSVAMPAAAPCRNEAIEEEA